MPGGKYSVNIIPCARLFLALRAGLPRGFFLHGEDAGQLADEVDKLGIGGHDDFGVVFQRRLHGLQLAEQLRVADEVLLRGFVDESYGLRLAFGGENLCLLDALGLLDLGPFLAVRRRLGGRGEVDGRDLFVFGLDDLVHRLLDVLRGIDLLELRPGDQDAPVPRLRLKRLVQLGVDDAALAVGRTERHGADDVSERRPGQVDDLVIVIIGVVHGRLDALLVLPHLEVDLRVDRGVQIVVGDDDLGIGVDHLLGDIHLIELLDNGHDPVEAGRCKARIFAERFHKSPVGRSDDAYA